MKRLFKALVVLALVSLLAYGAGRLYYRVTGGFTIGNISYALPYDARWDIKTHDKNAVDAILQQPFSYLGKGCQSYVFASQDGRYVLKFFKYQRFKPQEWLRYLTFLPGMEEYRQRKIEKKRQKLEGVFTSWKIAYENLSPETGVVYVHLNKTRDLPNNFTFYDKMGWQHQLALGDYEFLLQKRAKLLCPTLDEWMSQGRVAEAEQLLDRLIQMIRSEYQRGYADNDHALMQNTGVLDGQPVHIDVGQFVHNNRVKESVVFNQELFNKTWKFRKWLEQHHPQLARHLETLLKQTIGEEAFLKLKPHLNKATMGVLSHEPEA